MKRSTITIFTLAVLLSGMFRSSVVIAQGKKKVHFSFFPAGSEVTGPTNLIITATTASFYLSTDSAALSTVTVAPYFPLPSHIGLGIRSNLVLPKWRIMGDMRYLYYPQNTWGLYGDPELTPRLMINYKYVRVYQTFLRKMTPHFYAGLGYQLDAHVDMDTRDTPTLRAFTQYKYGTASDSHSFSSGVSLNLLYDNRMEAGNYFNIAYRVNSRVIGSNTSWHSLYVDLRKYVPLGPDPDHLITFWTYYWTVFDSPAPFLDLPSIGWDPYQQRSARGFPQNRFRGTSLVYGESEYRTPFFANGHLGFVLFCNVNSVAEPASSTYSYFHPAAGGGVRLKFSKVSTAKIAVDFAISDGYAGFYLNLGDTF